LAGEESKGGISKNTTCRWSASLRRNAGNLLERTLSNTLYEI
jgi:hypothetical protein